MTEKKEVTMKRERARIDELREMPYEEYLRTPEWMETQRAALKRAGNRCQICRSEEASPNVYHTSYENLGCEQESDVIALCEACYDRCVQSSRVAQQDDTAVPAGEEPQASADFSLPKKALIFTPTALLLDGLLWLLHAPLPAEVFGVGAALALAIKSPKIYAELRGSLPASLVSLLDSQAERRQERAATGDWSWGDRLLGRHLRDTDALGEGSDERNASDEGEVREALPTTNGLVPFGYYQREEEVGEWTGFRTPGQSSLYRLNLGSHTIDVETLHEQTLIFEMLTEGTGNITFVLSEELASKRVPLLIVDFGGFHPLVSEMPAGYLFGGLEGLRSLPVELQHRSIPIDRSQAERLGQTMLHEGWQGILCFNSYASPVEASAILLLILQGMRRWQLQRVQLGEEPLPCIILLNDAHRVLPYHDAYSVAKDDPTTAQKLRNNLLAYLQARGQYGLYLYLVTSRVTAMNRAALGACGMWLVRQPPQSELRCLSESTGLAPQVFRQVRPDQVLLVDMLAKRSFPVTLRQSMSFYETQSVPLLIPAQLMETTIGVSTQGRGAPFGLATTLHVTQAAASPMRREAKMEDQSGEGSAASAAERYSDKLLAYACYLYSIGWHHTSNPLRRVPDPLFDMARALGLNPVKGRDLMRGPRASALLRYVKEMPRQERSRYIALARPYAPAQAPRPSSGGDHTTGHDPPRNANGWRLPPLGVLTAPTRRRTEQVSETVLEDLRRIVADTLNEQRVEADVLRSDIRVGPRVIRIGVRPRRYPELISDGRGGKIPRCDEDGNILYKKTKVKEITALEKDFKLALAAKTLRMQAPVPGTDYVGIEIENPTPNFVTFYEVFTSEVYQEARRRSPLTIALGKDITGCVRPGSIEPHLLVAGQTGSGKSVGINAIIASVLMQATPEDIGLLMVDPKMVEFTRYKGIPHLLAPVITEVEQVKPLLQMLIHEMTSRYHLLADAHVRDIQGYEEKRAATPGLKRLPRIIVVIDELADLMMSGTPKERAEMEQLICRLAQKARSAGIHLVLGTQRPTVDVVSGNIKANMPVRIAYRVASGTDDRTIMDEGGADQLLGKGDLLYLTPEAGGPERVQGTLLSDQEIDAIVDHWIREQARRQESGAQAGSSYTLPEHPVQLSFVSEAATQAGHEQGSARHATPLPGAAGGGDDLLKQVLKQVIAELPSHTLVSVDMFRKGEYSPSIPSMGHERAREIRDELLRRGLIGGYSATSKGHAVLVHQQDGESQGEQEVAPTS
jgi:hypothetical protein